MSRLGQRGRASVVAGIDPEKNPTAAPCPISLLAPKSLYLTRPGLGPHTANKKLIEGVASPLFQAIENGLSIPIHQHYQLKDAAKAHEDLAARKTIVIELL